MKVYFEISTNPRKPGFVYCTVRSVEDGGCLIGATLDYCLDAAAERGYEVVNAQDVLTAVHKAGTVFKL